MDTPFVTYDAVANARYLRLSDHAVAQTIELSDSVYLDLGAQIEPVGLEVLYAQGPLSDALRNVSAGARLADLLALVV
jgi:uncharacterized protein YuzE